MRELSLTEVESVSGAGIVGDTAGCIGGGLVLMATDGGAIFFGVGIATAGLCWDAGNDWAEYMR